MADAIFTDRSSRGKPLLSPGEAILRDLYEVQQLTTREIARRFHACRSRVSAWFKEHEISLRKPGQNPIGVKAGLSESILKDLYEVRGFSIAQIGKMLDVSHSTVARYLDQFGITKRLPKDPVTTGTKRPDESVLRDLYEVQGMKAADIGKMYDVAGNTVVTWMKLYGIPRQRVNMRKKADKLIISESDIKRLYVNQGLSISEAGRQLGVRHGTVARYMVRYGIPIRQRMPQVKKNSREYVILYRTKEFGVKTPRPREKAKEDRRDFDACEARSLYESGLSLHEVGERFGLDKTTIGHRLKNLGVEIRPGGFGGGEYFAKNGLPVRSSYEMRVANWMIDHNITFEYEPKYPSHPMLRADFLANGWYVEIWGVQGNEAYRQRKTKKIELCRSYDLPLIQFNYTHFAPRAQHILEAKLNQILEAPAAPGMPF